ncbi:MAG: metal ABC transporter permease, partial [Candidatus Heimdallarchaeota archaeon]
MSKLVDFFQAFQYGFMQRALIAGVIIGIVCSIIGVFVLLKGMVFLGQAIAHSSFAGATLAILVGVQNP